MPKGLLNKLMNITAVGIGILATGLIIGYLLSDHVLVILSILVSAGCFTKLIVMIGVILKKDYITLSGMCTLVQHNLIGGLKTVILVDAIGNSVELKVHKSTRICEGEAYVLYLQKSQSHIANTYVTAILNTDFLLGIERIT